MPYAQDKRWAKSKTLASKPTLPTIRRRPGAYQVVVADEVDADRVGADRRVRWNPQVGAEQAVAEECDVTLVLGIETSALLIADQRLLKLPNSPLARPFERCQPQIASPS